MSEELDKGVGSRGGSEDGIEAGGVQVDGGVMREIGGATDDGPKNRTRSEVKRRRRMRQRRRRR